MTRLPENGASMADAARTRENERGCICDGCDADPDDCGEEISFCEETLRGEDGDQKFEERRELGFL